MKFSYNWIRELVEGLDCAPGPLERLITMKTAECEGIERSGELLERACAARVESVEPIPGGHNVKAVVDAGRYGRKTVVCGAPNCRPGMITAYAPVGKKTIDGVESDGMLASGAELGINRDHAGMIELDSQAGAPLPGCVPDSVIEIDNKSITHRPDLWGHLGMAREVAAILARKLKDPVKLGPAARGSGGHPDRDRRPRPLPALQRPGVRERHRAALAAVAAIPADRHRPEPHQQHRRHDELRDGRAGPAHARLRRGPAPRRYHLRPPRPARRARSAP